jgi:predicted Zn-dependent peptidase
MTPTSFDSFTSSVLTCPTLHRLSNGLTIIAEQIPVEAVNLSLWLGVGSSVESDGINGMAHFLEHMIFKGTPRLASGVFERLVEERGAYTNAATSQDYTHYFITTAPSNFAELAPHQIEVVLNAAIPNAAFERERSVVLEEIRRSEDKPRRRTFRQVIEMVFERLPYRRPVLGTTAIVEQLTPQMMRDFHQTWYQPQSITAVAVGNLPVNTLIEIVSTGFTTALSNRDVAEAAAFPSAIPNPLFQLADLTPESPFQEIVRHESIDPSLQQARLVMSWRVPGIEDLPQTYALDVIAAILGQGRTSRLVEELREQQGLVSAISVSNMTYTCQGVFYISAQLPEEHLETVERSIAQHVRRLQQEPVSSAEIQRVRRLVANRYIFGTETPSDRAGLYGYYQSVMGDLSPALTYPDQIRALETADLLAAAQQYLNPDAYGVVIIRSC